MQSCRNETREKTDRSTSGVSRLAPDKIGDLFCNFIAGKIEETTTNGEPLSDILRLATQDPRACCQEGPSASPVNQTIAPYSTVGFGVKPRRLKLPIR